MKGVMFMKLKSFIEKTCAVLLAGVMVINSSSIAYGAQELTDVKKFEVVDSDITYNIKMCVYDESTKFVVTNDSNKDYSEIVINTKDTIIESTNYTYEGKTFLGTELYDESEEEIDYSELEVEDDSSFDPQGIVYENSVKEKYKNDYWYAYGHGEQTAKKYLKIGCTATYRIRTDNLTSVKKINCDKYTTAIKNCNSRKKAGDDYAARAGLSAGLILGLVVANATLPPTVIITVVVAAVGGGAAVKNTVNAYIDAKGYYEEARDVYKIIRDYGTKL